jgi:flagellar biosynthesis anti-sigma factor FlgM
MRIDLNYGPQPVTESGFSNAPGSAAAHSSGGVSAGDDEAQLSGTHVQVEALAGQAAQLPEVRQERVSALRQAVASGQYQPATESVSGAMFDHMMVAAFA